MGSIEPKASADLKVAGEAYARGLFQRCLSSLGPEEQWAQSSNPDVLVLAARLCSRYGMNNRSTLLLARARRVAPNHEGALVQYGYRVLAHRGPIHLLEYLGEKPGWHGAEAVMPVTHADWLGLRAIAMSFCRDFTVAEALLEEAVQVHAAGRYTRVLQSRVAAQQDQLDRALALSEQILVDAPTYFPALNQQIDLLRQLDREEESFAVIQSALQATDAVDFAYDAAAYYENRRAYPDMLSALQEAQSRMHLSNRLTRRQLAGRLCDAYCYLHRYDEAQVQAEAAIVGFSKPEKTFFGVISQRLQDATETKVKQLDVPFERQDYRTCGPATLTALARYWGRPIDQMHVVDAICYDGTTDHAERVWALENGFTAREFLVTWDAARLLIDNDIPFALCTTSVESAHLQAVIGYDTRRGTLFVREPSSPNIQEYDGPGLVEAQKAYGPRGLAIVPPEHGNTLAQLELPETNLYDILHRQRIALAQHRRNDAESALRELEACEPEHRLTWYARRGLASYDGRSKDVLRALEALAALAPDDLGYQMYLLNARRGVTGDSKYIEALTAYCADKPLNPYARRDLASERYGYFPERSKVQAALSFAARRLGADPKIMTTYGHIAYDRQKLKQSAYWYRLAAHADWHNEDRAWQYARVLYELKDIDGGYDFLLKRKQQLGDKKLAPAMTLHRYLDHANRNNDAEALLLQLQEQFPEDDVLLRFLGRKHLYANEQHQVDELLPRIRERSPPVSYRYFYWDVLENRCEREVLITDCEEYLAEEPNDLYAWRQLATATADQFGPTVTAEKLLQALRRYPENIELCEFVIPWLVRDNLALAIAELDTLLERDPTNAWAIRERAWYALRQGDLPSAQQAGTLAKQYDPESGATLGLLGELAQRVGNEEEAYHHFTAAMRIDIGNTWPIHGAYTFVRDVKKREAWFMFFEEELIQQGYSGDAVHIFVDQLVDTHAPEVVLARLRALAEQRRDLWQVRIAILQQLITQEAYDQALSESQAIITEFPLLPRLYLERARVAEAARRPDLQEEALLEALRLAPSWDQAMRSLALFEIDRQNYSEAERILQQAVGSEPRVPANHGILAQCRQYAGDTPAAVAGYVRAVELSVDYRWAWNQLEQLDYETALNTARRLTEAVPGSAMRLLRLAEIIVERDLSAALAAVERAMELEPHDEDVLDSWAWLQGIAGEYDHALKFLNERAPLPDRLRRRVALLQWRQGDLVAANASFEGYLGSNPMDVTAIRQSIDLCIAMKDYDRAAPLIAQWKAYFPRSTQAWWAEANLKKAQGAPRPDIAAIYQQICQLDPTDDNAAAQAIHLAIDAKEDCLPEWALRTVRLNGNPSWRAGLFVHAGIKMKEDDLFKEALHEVISHPHIQINVAKDVLEEVDKAGRLLALKSLIQQAINDQEIGPGGAHLYGKIILVNYRQEKIIKLLRELSGHAEFGHVLSGVILAIENSGKYNIANRLWLEFQSEIVAHDHAWASTVRAAYGAMNFQAVGKLTQGWPDRLGTEGWMLFNLADLFIAQNKWSEAVAAAEKAQYLDDGGWPGMAGLLAFYQILHNDHEAGQAFLRSYGDSDAFDVYLWRPAIAATTTDRASLAASSLNELRAIYRQKNTHKGIRTVARNIHDKALALCRERWGRWAIAWRRFCG